MASSSSSSLALPAVKRALRKSVQHQLRALSPSAIQAQSNDLLQRVISTEPYLSSRSLSIYLSMPHSEVQTLALVQHALGQDKIVWVPFIPKGGRMTMVRLYKDDGKAEWERDGWGIPVVGRERREHLGPRDDALEPTTADLSLDLIYLPAVAFSPSPTSPKFIDRLGHGKGYYDTFLETYEGICRERGWKTPTLVGLALKEQWLDKGAVPTSEHDFPLEHVLVASSSDEP